MNGVIVRKTKIVSDDERRTITEVMNGELRIANLKILHVKKGEQLLGNHWHQYSEVMHIIKGKAKYRMKNIDTGEQQDYDLEEGDTIFRTGRVTHSGWFEEDSIILDGAECTYIGSDFNDIKEVILE
jgi:mannose-6-phosphate isomerase-like protein (cupin superfamily)